MSQQTVYLSFGKAVISLDCEAGSASINAISDSALAQMTASEGHVVADSMHEAPFGATCLPCAGEPGCSVQTEEKSKTMTGREYLSQEKQAKGNLVCSAVLGERSGVASPLQ